MCVRTLAGLFVLAVAASALVGVRAAGQPLVQVGTIPLRGVEGRIRPRPVLLHLDRGGLVAAAWHTATVLR